MAKGRIPDRDIAAIRERTQIEEVVADYVQLRPAGVDSLKGLSPFKDERTPSFHVRPNHGYFHCFSTGEGGDVFKFLMLVDHLTFPEAVEACAERIGYTIHYEGATPGRARDHDGPSRLRLIAANKAAHEFYQEQLGTPEAKLAREFLTERGFGRAHAEHFGCGFAPAGWDTVTTHLVRQGFSIPELEAAGLTKQGRRGPIDRFHRRLLWPINSIAGDVIGFGARKIFPDDTLAKYLNTPETLLYKKSQVLYGLELAKKSIATDHRAVIVEGYTDVMAMHAAGITHAVASCGTAFGDGHVQLLRRLMLDDNHFRGELIYTFDGDEAGQKAAMKAFAGDQAFAGQSYVVTAPDGMDPCDVRQHQGDAALRDLLARRRPLFEFVIRRIMDDYDLDSAEGRISALRRVVPEVAKIKDTALRDDYARRVAGWAGWEDTADVVRRVRAAAQGERSQALTAPVVTGLNDPSLSAQREALKVAIQYPVIVGPVFDSLPAGAMSHPAYHALSEAIAQAGGVSGPAAAAGGVRWLSAVREHVPDEYAGLLSELDLEPIAADEASLPGFADAVVARLHEVWVGHQVADLKGRLQRMRPRDDEQAYEAVFADLVALEQYRRSLIERAFGRK